MSPLEWIILGIILLLGAGACVAVNHIRKTDGIVPGRL